VQSYWIFAKIHIVHFFYSPAKNKPKDYEENESGAMAQRHDGALAYPGFGFGQISN